jgi:hypothetical protein
MGKGIRLGLIKARPGSRVDIIQGIRPYLGLAFFNHEEGTIPLSEGQLYRSLKGFMLMGGIQRIYEDLNIVDFIALEGRDAGGKVVPFPIYAHMVKAFFEEG